MRLKILEEAGFTYMINVLVKKIMSMIYPVGSIYISVNPTNPAIHFGGEWVEWGSGRVLVGVNVSDSDFNTSEKIGGNKNLQSHSHIIGPHEHEISFNTKSSGSHEHSLGTSNNPYVFTTSDSGTGSDIASSIAGSGYKYPRATESNTISRNSKTNNTGNHYHSIEGDTEQSNSYNSSTTGSGSSGNLQPYITCYMFKRVK